MWREPRDALPVGPAVHSPYVFAWAMRAQDEDVLRAEEETKWRQSLEAKHAALCDKYGLTEQALGESRRTCQALKEELVGGATQEH